MNIKQLTATGFKSGRAPINHDLTPLTIITGPNWSGKTARLDAIRVGLMGYLPELGKTAPATMTLADGPALMVNLCLSDGTSITRGWTTGRGGKVTAQTPVGDIAVPPVLLDSNEYFALGDKDRVRYVFSHCPADFPAATADAIIGKVKSIVALSPSEHHEPAIAQMVGRIDQSDRVRHDLNESVQDWIEKLIVELRNDNKLAKANADRMAKTVEGLAVVTGDDEEAVRNVAGEMDKIGKMIGDLKTEHGELSERIRNAEGAVARRAKFEVEAAKPDRATELAEARLAIRAIEGELDGYTSDLPRLRAAEQSAGNEVRRLATMIDLAKTEREKAKANFQRDIAADKCPHCGACGSGWQENIIALHDANDRELVAQIDQLTVHVTAADTAHQSAIHALAAAEKLDTTIQNRARELRSLQSAVGLIERAVNERKVAVDYLALDKAERQDDLTAIHSRQAEIVNDLSALTARQVTLADRQRAFHQVQQDAKRAAQARIECEKIKAVAFVTKTTLDIMEALQVAMVDHAFKALLETANNLCAGLLKSPLCFYEGEVGRWEGARWVGHRTFSGTEKALAYAGISIALAQSSPIKIVLLDECGRIDWENKAALVERLMTLIKDGTIDQSIMVDTDAEWNDGRWDVWGLSVIEI